jgi:hypothetical protein
VLIPGWRELRSAPLEEICARQYIVCNEAALAARELAPERWLDLVYEDVAASPVEELRGLFGRLGLEFTSDVERFAAALPSTPGPTALTPPKREKWREQNPAEIERILPLVAPLERRLGYA